jgi:hypothetical protein
MAINTLSKNSIGVVLALLLVIILSETKMFNLFTDTYLGRSFLIIIILFASYLNKILGIVCVFIIIIMFSNNNSFFEGIDGVSINNKKEDKGVLTGSPDTTDTTITTNIKTHAVVPNDKINVTTKSSTDTTDKSIEGFDLQATENNIKRGKQSNSIPVNQYYNQSIDVSPYEGSKFSNLFGFLKL